MLVFSSLDPFDDLIAGVPMNFSCKSPSSVGTDDPRKPSYQFPLFGSIVTDARQSKPLFSLQIIIGSLDLQRRPLGVLV